MFGNNAASFNVQKVIFKKFIFWKLLLMVCLDSAINGLETWYGSGNGSGTGTVMRQKSEPESEP